MKSGNILNDLRSQMIRIGADDYEFEGSTIIYCPTKKSTEDVLNIVKSKSVNSCMLGFALYRDNDHIFRPVLIAR